MSKNRWVVAAAGVGMVAALLTGSAAYAEIPGGDQSRNGRPPACDKPGEPVKIGVPCPAPGDPKDNGGPKNDGPKGDGPKGDGPRHDGPKGDGPRHDGPKGGHEVGDGRHESGPKRDHVRVVLEVKKLRNGKKVLVARVWRGDLDRHVTASLLKYDGRGKWKTVAKVKGDRHGVYVFKHLPGKYKVVIKLRKGRSVTSNVVVIARPRHHH